MAKLITRKMKIGDHISIKKNVFTGMPLEMIEENVKNNVKAMEEGTTNWIYLVAELEGEVVGTTYVELGQSSVTNHIATLYSVVTSEDHRGKGICRMLFEESINQVKDKGVEKIILSVRKGTPAETVYQKMGFTKYGELPNGIKEDDGYYSDVFYYYDINY